MSAWFDLGWIRSWKCKADRTKWGQLLRKCKAEERNWGTEKYFKERYIAKSKEGKVSIKFLWKILQFCY